MSKCKLAKLLVAACHGELEEITDNLLDHIKEGLVDGKELIDYDFNVKVYKVAAKTYLVLNEDSDYLGIWYSFCKDNDADNTCLCSKGSIENVDWVNVLRLRNEVWEKCRDKSYQTNKYRPVFNSTEIDIYE